MFMHAIRYEVLVESTVRIMTGLWCEVTIFLWIHIFCSATVKSRSEDHISDVYENIHSLFKADVPRSSIPSMKLSAQASYATDIEVTWTSLSHQMKQVDTGLTPHVWATDLNKDVYYLNGDIFDQVPGKLMYVTSGEAGVWGIDERNKIFYREGVDQATPTGTEWKQIKGSLFLIDSGPTGIVCGVTSSFKVFCRTEITNASPTGKNWQRIAGRMKYISCCNYGCWAISKYNNVYFTSQINGWSTKWTKIGCDLMVKTEARPNGQVWGLNPSNELFVRIGVDVQNFPSELAWRKIDSKRFVSVSIGVEKIYAVDTENAVYVGSIVGKNSSDSFVNKFVNPPRPGRVLMNVKIERCLVPSSIPPTEGTAIIHTFACRDSSVLFRVLDSGAIQHVQSGLCIHLSGNRECPKKRELAILKRDCSDPRYFFKYTGKGFQLRQMCLGPWSFRWPDKTKLAIYSGRDHCNNPETTYNMVDIIKGCDLQCLKDIISGEQSTSSFDEFFKRSETEARSLASKSSNFISTLRQEMPEFYKDVFSTFFPVDPKILENLEILMNHFGIEKVKAYPSLFLATAFIRRNIGVDRSEPAVCGGTGIDIGGEPAIDEEDAEYKLSLDKSQLASLLDDEDYRAQQAIDKEREKDETAGINTNEYKVSAVQQLIDQLDGKYYDKLWTAESLKTSMDLCGFTNSSNIKFPPRGDGMSGIEYLEYYLSRNLTLLPESNLKFPWPLAINLNIRTSLRQCNWIWHRLENDERIVRYSRYTRDYNLKEVKCKESDWNPCSIPRIIEDGGVCERQSTLARVTNHCLGIASGGIKQPGHAAGYTYTKPNNSYKFQVFQGITSIMNTYAVWKLIDNQYTPEPKLNAEYHMGLANAMNHGYESYRNGRIALLIFSRIYDRELRLDSRDLLVEALEGNPHMMDVWMKLIHDVTGSNALPIQSNNVFTRIPAKCPDNFDDSLRNRLIAIINKHLNKYMQMYIEVLFRLISPPTCCTDAQPKYLENLRSAWKNEQRPLVKEYLLDGYVSCASKSATIREVVGIIQQKIVTKGELLELDVFLELLHTIQSIATSREDAKIEENRKVLNNFFIIVCDFFQRFHVTASAWVIAAHYRACVKAQLELLSSQNDKTSFENVFVAWTKIQDNSAKTTKTWNEYFLKDWLYGRTGDIIPLLVGVKESVDGGMILERKVNLATKKQTAQSSTLKDITTSERAVDGNTDNLLAGGSCAVTKKQNNPWFRVDLENSKKVYGLLMSNADDKITNGFRKFEIHIGDNLGAHGVTNPTCGNLHSIRRGQTRAFYCDPPLIGRYITINILGTNQALAICEIAVYDSELSNYRSNGLKLDTWYNAPTKDIQQLHNDTRNPDHPDHSTKLETFDYKRTGDAYGSRLSAVYQPQETGNFTFYVACTDQCEVFLGYGESGGKLQKVISPVKATKYQDYSADQKSPPIHLKKRRLYELVATLKENNGQDYITVAVKLPSDEFLTPGPMSAEGLFIGHVFMNARVKRCLLPASSHPIEGTKVIHTSSCRDSLAFFKVLDTGAIQHVQSGLCIHLSGNRWNPRNRERAILKRDCSNPKFFFTYTGKSLKIRKKCLRPSSFNRPEKSPLIISSGCNTYETTYNFVDIIKGCDLDCLKFIKSEKRNTSSFDEFFKRSEAEARSLASNSSNFISTLRQEMPELYKDVFSTFFPVDPKIFENLEILMNHFGMEKIKAYPSLFLATSFIRRNIGVDASEPAVCGGTGRNIAGVPAIDEEDAEYKLSLSPSELASLLDDEDYKAQQAIDKEREEDEKAGINTDEFRVSAVQKLIDRLDGKYHHKFWTPESLKDAMNLCGFTDPRKIEFPPRGDGMSAIEYLEYYFSRNSTLLDENNLKFPWPLAIALNIRTSLRQCNWVWRRLENGERIVRYSKYTFHYNLQEVKCKPSDWNLCAIPRIIEDGGVCGRQSTLARVTNHCLGIASGGIKQPAHAAGYTYTKSNEGYRFKIFQGITNMMNTYAVWQLTDDAIQFGQKINAEYHQGLTRAMNHGYESYRNGRIALLIFSRIYDATQRHSSRDLLVEALEGNPHMMDVWMKLIHDVTESNDLPSEGQNVFKRIPSKCPQGLDESLLNRVEILVKQFVSSYMQMYLEVLLRLLAPPSCCSVGVPKYLNILRSSWENEKRALVKEYLFDAYVSCASKSACIPEFVGIVQQHVFSQINTKLPELDTFSELLNSLSALLNSRSDIEVQENQSLLLGFFTNVCDVLPRIHVTASAWVIAPHYRACVETQLKFLEKYVPELYQNIFDQWSALEDKSAKPKEFWNELFMKDWLYGRSGDIIPLLVGVKENVDGGFMREIKVNIAKNQSTAISSTWKSQTQSMNAVDGNTDHLIAGGSCAVTKNQNNPWFRLELQNSTMVYGLLISNTEDKQGNQLQNFEIHIGDSLNQNGVTNARCGNRHFMRRGETKAFYCVPPIVGKYITINIPANRKMLPICEIAVYDSELTSYRKHGVKMNIWRNLASNDIQRLYNDPKYPDKPDEQRILSTFDYKNMGSYYGGRLSALYQPLETGNYTFYAACTDKCEVFLKDDDERGEKLEKIISLMRATNYKVWNQYPSQKSKAIYLEKGKFYELVATIKEATRSDYLSVAVKLPSGDLIAPVPAERLYIDTKEKSKVFA